MSPHGTTIAQRIAANLEDLREHEKQQPAEVEAIVAHLVLHLRAWRPESVSPLGTLPAPGEVIRDPRANTSAVAGTEPSATQTELVSPAIIRQPWGKP